MIIANALRWIRAAYASWAIQYVSPLDDYYLTLSRWIRDERLNKFLKGDA